MHGWWRSLAILILAILLTPASRCCGAQASSASAPAAAGTNAPAVTAPTAVPPADLTTDDKGRTVVKLEPRVEQALLGALRKGDQPALRDLLNDYPEALTTVIENQPLINYAITFNNLPAFRLLAGKGADLNQTNHMGRTPLIVATLVMRPAFLRELLQNKSVNVYAKDSAGMTAMDYANRFAEQDAINLRQMFHRPESVKELIEEAKQVKQLFAEFQSDFLITERQALSWLPEEWQQHLRHRFLGQELWRYLLGLLALLATLLFNALVVGYADALSRKLDEQEERRGGLHSFFGLSVKALRRALRFFSWCFGLYLMFALAAPSLVAPFAWIPEVIVAISVSTLLYDYIEVIDYYISLWAQKSGYSIESTLIPLMRRILRALIVLLTALHLYQVVTGNTVTTVIAGLGIGGMAVALAATDTLKNFIGFIMILLDRPFVVGERIVFDGHDGTVEYIGLRTTRMRRLDSSQVSIPNSKAVDSVVLNLGRRRGFKRVANIGLTYDTPPHKVEEALAIVRLMLDAPECARPETPPQVYFTEFKADSLNLEIVYWITGDWASYCRFNERFNLELMRRFAEAGIDMAFPTQTVYLAGDPKRPLTPGATEGRA